MRSRISRHLLGRADGDDPAAAAPSFGTEINDPVGRLDHVEIVLDDQHGVARIGEIVEHFEQHLDVGEVQPGGRLVEEIERAAGALFDQLAGQLDPLRLAPGKSRRWLAELEVIESHVVQRLQLMPHVGDILEMRECLLDVHLQHVGDALPFEPHLKRFAIEAVPFADRASDPNVGEKIHFQPRRAVPLAGLAPSAAHVEAESPRLVAARFRFGQLGVQIADIVEDFDIRGRIGARRAANRRLVDGDQFVEMPESVDPLVQAGMRQSRRSDRGGGLRPRCR